MCYRLRVGSNNLSQMDLSKLKINRYSQATWICVRFQTKIKSVLLILLKVSDEHVKDSSSRKLRGSYKKSWFSLHCIWKYIYVYFRAHIFTTNRSLKERQIRNENGMKDSVTRILRRYMTKWMGNQVEELSYLWIWRRKLTKVSQLMKLTSYFHLQTMPYSPPWVWLDGFPL